jgi:hypothetical protein
MAPFAAKPLAALNLETSDILTHNLAVYGNSSMP